MQAVFYAVFTGPQNVSVMIEPSDFKWNGAAYAGTAELNATGTYALRVMRGAVNLMGSPLQLQILPGPTSATASLVYGSALDTAVAGLNANITVQVRL